MSKKLFSFLVCFMLTAYVLAQDTTTTLNEVIITANKFPVKQNETGKVVTVITQDQLKKSYGRSLTELLNEQVGVAINGSTNVAGTNQTVYVRGAAGANTLILVDGVPINDASGTTGEFDLNNFALFNIERIEILKGSQSTLYGSDAVAGVINIITKKSGQQPASLNLVLSAGTYGTYKGSVGLNGTSKGYSYSLSYNKHYSRGMSAAYDSTGKGNFDNDKFDQELVHLSVGKKFNKLETRIYGKYNVNRAAIDAGAFRDDRDYTYRNKNGNVGTKIVYTLPVGALNFNYNYNSYDRHFTDDSGHRGTSFVTFQQGDYTSKSHFAELYSNIPVKKNVELLTGLDYRRNASDQAYQSLSGFGPYNSMPLSADSNKTNQYSGYASVLVKDISGFYAELGGRWNHHSVYGDNVTFSFNPSYLVNSRLKLFANISSGFRAPSLYQLYSEYGNAGLKPEKSTNYEIGSQYTGDKFTGRIVGFKRDIKDVFVFYTDPNFVSRYINEDQQRDHGTEVEAGYKINDKITASANYTWVDGEIDTQTSSGKDTSFFNLYRRPEHTLNLSMAINITKAIYIRPHFHYVSKFFEPVFNSAPLEADGYYTLNLYTEYAKSSKLRVFADLRNLTDRKYFEARGFNSRRFNFNAGVNINL